MNIPVPLWGETPDFLVLSKYAAYLNLIESWWKTLRALALKGRRFVTWEEIGRAIEPGAAYWNKHRHPFKWGERRRHRRRAQTTPIIPFNKFQRRRQPVRPVGIATLPK